MQETPSQLLKTIKLYIPDLWSANAHSSSFQNTRSGYLRNRISMLAAVWGLLVFIWIPFDLFLLPESQSVPIVIARILLGIFLLVLAKVNYRLTKLKHAQICMGLLVTATNLFYLNVISILEFPSVFSGYFYGYTLLPIIHVAMLTILPVTLKESLGLLVITAFAQLFTDFQTTNFPTPENIADYWLQTILAMMVIWSQLSKLYMLMRLYRQATLDPLTGIYNRRMLLQLANKCMHHCDYSKQPFSVMLFDIDKFKRINDTWGHSAGDQVLKEFTQFIQSQTKGDELFGRFGGEEFILFLPKTHVTQAEQLADKLLASIRQLELDIGVDDTKIRITTSIGISSFTDGDTLSSLLERADNALYECKDAGRDCRRYHPAGYHYSSRAECKLVG